MTFTHEDLLKAIHVHKVGQRTDSAAMLAWFLQEVWGIESEAVPESICDASGDKGIDAIVVDEHSLTITLFQAKYFASPSRRKQGDKDLRDFVGAARWFRSATTVRDLSVSQANGELKRLIARLGIESLMENESYEINLVFVTNGELTQDAIDYIDSGKQFDTQIEMWDQPRLLERGEHAKAADLLPNKVHLRTSGGLLSAQMGKKDGARIAIGLVSANELTSKLPGIGDQTIFSSNVRLYKGRGTKVNSDLTKSMMDSSNHDYFPAYHNGLTLITRKLTVDKNVQEIQLDGVAVVNGCQSLMTMHSNQSSLTSRMRMVVKVVEVGDSEELARQITYRSNNQNAVTLRDQRSNDPSMRAIQSKIQERYDGRFALAIKTGEKMGANEVMENSLAAQLLMACELKEPWNAVRKLRLFDEDYRRLFNKDTKPDSIFLLHLIDKAVEANRDSLSESIRSSYSAFRFALVFVVSEIMRLTDEGKGILEFPEKWLPGKEVEVFEALNEIAAESVEELNDFVEDKEETGEEGFDPKTIFKSQIGVNQMARSALKTHKRRLRRGQVEYLFNVEPLESFRC